MNKERDYDFEYLDYLLGNFKSRIKELEEVIAKEEEKSLMEIKTKNQTLFDSMADSIRKADESINNFSNQIVYKKAIKNIEETGYP